VAANVVGILLVSVLSGMGVPVQDQSVRYLAGTVITGVGFGGVVALYLSATEQYDLVAVGWPSRRDVAVVAGGVVALLAALFAINVVFAQFGVTTAQHQIEDVGGQNPTLLLLMMPLAVLVIGPAEELLFRGAIQGVLRRAYSPLPAIAIASLLFGVGHITALTGDGKASSILVILLLGAILGAIYEYTDNIVVPALVHGIYNVFAFLQIYLTAT